MLSVRFTGASSKRFRSDHDLTQAVMKPPTGSQAGSSRSGSRSLREQALVGSATKAFGDMTGPLGV